MHRHSDWLEWAVRRLDGHDVSHHMPLPLHLLRMVDPWKHVQTAIVKLFQRKPLREHELGTLQSTIRTLSEAEAGSLIYEYYKDQLLKKGMVILREKIKNEQGAELLTMLGETWDYFFRQILPSLQALMYPLAEVMKDIDIRNTTLLVFRNIVVLKVGLKDAVESKKYQVPASIRQMLLVLQGLKDPTFLSKDQLDLEKMVACVIVPFMGTRGLYLGSPDPVTKATYRPPMPHVSRPMSKPRVTISVCEDRPRQGGSPPALRHSNAGLLTSTHLHLHRKEQQHHPIASPAAMRRRHPPYSSPPKGECCLTAAAAALTAAGGGGSLTTTTAIPPRLKPVIEVVPDVALVVGT